MPFPTWLVLLGSVRGRKVPHIGTSAFSQIPFLVQAYVWVRGHCLASVSPPTVIQLFACKTLLSFPNHLDLLITAFQSVSWGFLVGSKGLFDQIT